MIVGTSMKPTAMAQLRVKAASTTTATDAAMTRNIHAAIEVRVLLMIAPF
jgi:hypothetical protein